MTKLIIQIPCFNEENTLRKTLADIPREIEGVDSVEILVVDDGSTDRTFEVAHEMGVDHILRNKSNIGLARSFSRGLDVCLMHGADIIINTDGDNQYCGAQIPDLVRPIIEARADIVIGGRQTQTIEHFSNTKKLLHRLGGFVVRRLSGVQVNDAVSGFRAMSRDAALRLKFVTPFSYTVEMLIQAGKKQMTVIEVPIRTNQPTRESRLFHSIPKFIERSATTMVRTYAMYQPLRTFFYIGSAISVFGIVLFLRFLYFWITGDAGGHVQSLIFGSTSLVIGFVVFVLGLQADLINFNRHLLEIMLEKVRRHELDHAKSDHVTVVSPERKNSRQRGTTKRSASKVSRRA